MTQVFLSCLLILFTILQESFADGPPTECERGVKRHHPSQANAYQVFTREGYSKKWLDYTCPEYTIFDPRQCLCVESRKQRQERPMRVTRPQGTPGATADRRRMGMGRGSQQREGAMDGQDSYDTGKSRQTSWRHQRRGNDNDDSSYQNQEREMGMRGQREDGQSDGSYMRRQRGNDQSNDRNMRRQGEDGQSNHGAMRRQGEDGQSNHGAMRRQRGDGQSNDGHMRRQKEEGQSNDGFMRRQREEDQSNAGYKRSQGKDGQTDGGYMRRQKADVQSNDGYMRRQKDDSQSEDGYMRQGDRDKGDSDRKDSEDEMMPDGIDQDSLDCYLHRPADEPSHFERWSDEKWVEEDCNWPFYTGLVWNQDACRCEWGPNRTVALPDAENSVPATCLMMLKMTFDSGEVKDEGRNIWLNIQDRDHATAQMDNTAVGGYSGSFRGASIAVPYFKSNVLGQVFHIGFQFQLCPGQPDTDIPLVHNDCVETEDGPSIAVTYQAWKKQITVSMRTADSHLISEVCLINKPQTQWSKLDIRYGDNYLEVIADDKVCVESDKFYGPVATNNCPLTLLDETFCGKLDEVIITRGCTEAHAIS